MGWEEMTPSDAVEKADWIRQRLHPFAAYDVGSVIPAGFAAYARILHPAGRFGDPLPIEVRWSEVAAWSRKTIHSEVQFNAIAEPAPGDELAPWPWNYEPRAGVLSDGQIRALATLLAEQTTTPHQCWFCLWEGYGYLNPGGIAPLTSVLWQEGTRPPPPRFQLKLSWRMPRRAAGKRVAPNPQRAYRLFSGPVEKATGWEDGPNVWWPEDRAWCVASEIDHAYSYVGGCRALIDEVLAHPTLEAVPADITDGITYDSDKLNSTS